MCREHSDCDEYCWPDGTCGVAPVACASHATCENMRFDGAAVYCVPEQVTRMPDIGQMGFASDFVRSFWSSNDSGDTKCLPVKPLNLRTLVSVILESVAALAVDLDLYNRHGYAYRTTDARTGVTGGWYRPKTHEEAARLILLSRADRMNAAGVILCTVAMLMLYFTK